MSRIVHTWLLFFLLTMLTACATPVLTNPEYATIDKTNLPQAGDNQGPKIKIVSI